VLLRFLVFFFVALPMMAPYQPSISH